MLLEPKTIKIEYNFITSRENLKNYLKWIEYNPKHWNIKQLLKKTAKELSNEEIEILKLLKEAKEKSSAKATANNGKGISVGISNANDHYEYQVIRVYK